MHRQVTIVMYHYVRDLARSRYPAIKGLTLERFNRQLDHLQANYTPISVQDLFDALSSSQRKLPLNSVLLTFDDGYTDHFINVLPILKNRGMRGCFFPPAQAVLEHKVLDVNKIHFILASVSNIHTLLERLFTCLDAFRSEYQLKSADEYLQAVPREHRYDSFEIIAFKRLLQRDLPEPVRERIVARLFREYVTSDEASFARELYMSTDQIKSMHEQGMHIGSHGYTHAWLNHIPPATQAFEIDKSLDFLRLFGSARRNWTMCYPYGGYNESLLQILRNRQCCLGFTVEPRIADLDADDPLTLPRLDTNDLPS
jgi:peptidoglycan/xylan/chitin deacetylase (PgdA/CDA1 family)